MSCHAERREASRKVRANERNVNLFTNFSASAAELNDRVTNVIGQVPLRDPSFSLRMTSRFPESPLLGRGRGRLFPLISAAKILHADLVLIVTDNY